MRFRQSVKKPFALDPPKKIIIDIQGGLQDILAIFCAYKLIQEQQANTEIIGITCVSGRTTLQQASKGAIAANYLMNTKIPVYLGQRQSLLLSCKYPHIYMYPHHEQVEKLLYERSQGLQKCVNKQKKAVDFINQSVQKYGQQLAIVAFGPLTNIALAQRLQEQLHKIKLISVNGGQYSGIGITTEGNVQPNFAFDPLAVDILIKYRELKDKLYINPIEKTLQYDWRKTFQKILQECKLTEDTRIVFQMLVNNKRNQNIFWGAFLTIAPLICSSFVPFCHHVYAEIVRDSQKTDGLLAINWLKVGSNPNQFPDKTFIYSTFDQEKMQKALVKAFSL